MLQAARMLSVAALFFINVCAPPPLFPFLPPRFTGLFLSSRDLPQGFHELPIPTLQRFLDVFTVLAIFLTLMLHGFYERPVAISGEGSRSIAAAAFS
jgi:hypothetical protein